MKHQKITINLKNEILSGKYEYEKKLPSEHELAIKYETTRITIRKSLKTLIAQGYLYSKLKSGYYVNKKEIIDSYNRINAHSLNKLFPNDQVINKVINFEIKKASLFLQNKFELNDQSLIIFASRIRYLNKKVYIVENTYMPYELFPDITKETFEVSVYKYIESKDYILDKNIKRVGASLIPEDILIYMPELENEPVLFVENQGYFKNGKCFEYTHSYHINQDFTQIVSYW